MSVTRTANKTEIEKGVNPALEPLNTLIGEWKVELSFPTDSGGRAVVHASFEWLQEGAFLIYRLGERTAGPPYSVCVIGRDDSGGMYTMLYYDDRGVSRVYQMSLVGREWKQWREAPGFSQRFVGEFSADGNAINARWEKSFDGANWERDFDMTYSKM